jgi:hypothetical protein
MADPFGNISAQERLKIMAEINEEAKTLRSIEQEYGRLIKENSDVLESRSAKYTSERNAIESLSSSMNKDLLNQKKLETQISKIKRGQLNAEIQIFTLKEKIKALIKAGVDLTNKEIAVLKEAVIFEQDRANSLASAATSAGKLLEESKRISRLNPFKGLSELITGVPILSSLLKDLTNATDAFNTSMSDSKGFVRSFGAGLTEFLKLVSKSAQVFIAGTFIKSIKTIDESSVNLANQLNISKQEAGQLQIEFAKAAQENKSLLQTSQDLMDAQVKLGNALGTTAMFSKDTASTFNILTSRLGVSEAAASQLANFTEATGLNFQNFSNTVRGTNMFLGAQEEIFLNEKDLIEDISKTSSNILLSMQGQNISLGKAAFQARKLGLNLADMEKIQSSLLDFESSIQNELAAELLIGQNINLEKARSAALNNDLLGLGKALEQQGITQAKFASMNFVQQEAIAKTLGMSSKEMGDMFVKQTALRRLSAKTEKDGIKAIQERIRKGESEAKIIADIGSEELVKRAQNMTMQQKMNTIIQQLADKIMPVLVKVFTKIDSLLNSAGGYATEIGVALGALAIGGPIFRGISMISRLFGGMARSSTLVGNNLARSTAGGGGMGTRGMNPFTMSYDAAGRAQYNKLGTSITGKSGFVPGIGKAGKFARGAAKFGKFSPLGIVGGLALDYGADELKESGYETAGKGVSVASGLLTGASTGAMIGSVIPGVGTAIGGVVGGLIGGISSAISEFGDKQEEAINKQTQAIQQTNQIPPRIVLDGAALNQEGISTLRSNRFIQ